MKFLNQVFSALLAIAIGFSSVLPAQAAQPYSRLKDIADFEGVRENVLIGYGLVVGLAGTGDAANSIPFTRQTLINMLQRLGVNAKAAEAQLKTKNVAAVMVTADLPAFARQGSKMDVVVSSLGDAKSLEGGTLLATPMVGADGNTYAVAQGPVILGGFTAQGAAGEVTKNHTTAGRIADGAIIERETGHNLADQNGLRLMLRNPDFTTALRVRDAINETFGEPISKAVDNATIDITVPPGLADNMVPMIQRIENLRVRPDMIARIVVDEKTGTIVMGGDVQVSEVAVSHANLTVRITELQQVSQPDGWMDGAGQTAIVDRTVVNVDEGNGKFKMIESGVSLADLVDGLNSLGVQPRDIISILQTIKAAGALQAEIVVM